MPATRRSGKRNQANPASKEKNENEKDPELSHAEGAPKAVTSSPEHKTTDDENDLNYDEYDLAEECDISIKCKVCLNVFNSLEKFIGHKNANCKERRSVSKCSSSKKGSKPGISAVSGPVRDSVTLDDAPAPPRKRRLEELLSPEPSNTTDDIDLPKVGFSSDKSTWKVYASKRKKRPKPEPAVDLASQEVVLIDTSLPEPTPQELLVREESEEDMESDEDDEHDYNNIVTLSYKELDKDDDDIDLPVRLSCAPPTDDSIAKLNDGNSRKEIKREKSLVYTLVKVEEMESAPESCPCLALTVEQLKKVKFMNLLQPIPVSLGSFMGNDKDHRKKYVDEELENPSHPPKPTYALGFLQSVMAKTKDDKAVTLYIREVVEGSFKSFAVNDDIEEVEADNAGMLVPEIDEITEEADIGDDQSAVKAVKSMRKSEIVKRNMKKEEDDVCSDEDEVFEHDSSLYEYLRDDEQYILKPKQHGRLSRIDIRSRTDCDWAKLSCKTCGTVYSCTKTLINHMSYQHSDKKAFYPCIFCRNIYSQHKNVARHIMKTHNKTKDFVDKLRGFLRSQAFTRSFVNADINIEKVITEDNDPFMIRVRERRGQQPDTKYCAMSDKEIMSKYGRKIKIIGRPPGRPTKLSQQAIFFTCTLCNQEFSSMKFMLHHLRVEHQFLQRQINRMRAKLLTRVQEFQSTQKLRRQQEREELLKNVKSVPVKPGYMVDRYGRWIQPANKIQIPPATSVVTSTAMTTTPITDMKRVLKLLKCSCCNAMFTNQISLDTHACPGSKQAELAIMSKPDTRPTVLLMSPAKTAVSSPQQNLILQQVASAAQPQSPATVEVSGLETLAEISTNEANKTGATRVELQNQPTQTVIQSQPPQTVIQSQPTQTVIQSQPPQTVIQISSPPVVQTVAPARTATVTTNQVVTITSDQLEQLRRSGSNVIYLVNR